MLEVLYHLTKFGGDRISPAAGAAKNVEFFLSVRHAFSVRHACDRHPLNVRDCAPDFTMKHWSTEMILMSLDRGRFVVVHPCSTFSDCRQLSTSLNAEWFFSARGR